MRSRSLCLSVVQLFFRILFGRPSTIFSPKFEATLAVSRHVCIACSIAVVSELVWAWVLLLAASSPRSRWL